MDIGSGWFMLSCVRSGNASPAPPKTTLQLSLFVNLLFAPISEFIAKPDFFSRCQKLNFLFVCLRKWSLSSATYSGCAIFITRRNNFCKSPKVVIFMGLRNLPLVLRLRVAENVRWERKPLMAQLHHALLLLLLLSWDTFLFHLSNMPHSVGN